MSIGSAVPAVVDALIAALTTAGLAVIDGPGITDDPLPLSVHVGWGDPDSDQIEESASADQTWAWLGHTQRDETVTVHCRVVAWSGNSDTASMKAARDAAFGAFADIGSTIQSDPSLGASASGVLNVTDVGRIALYQVQDDEAGTRADVAFDVTCRARLT